VNDSRRAPLTHRQVLVVFSGLMLGLLLAALDQTIVATALPTIVGDLGGLDQLPWVVTSYLLASTVSAPLYGKLGDLYGRKRLFQAAIVVFLTGSDTSANALFGNLQVVTANQIGLNPVLTASVNSAAGVMGKMISIQSIAVAVAATGMTRDDESRLFRFTIKHSILLMVAMAIISMLYAYVFPAFIPIASP